MAIYSFAPHSPISSVRLHYVSDRPPVALLFSGQWADSQKLEKVKQLLRDKQYHFTPVNVDGKDALQVDGFAKADELMTLLRSQGAAQGEAQLIRESGDNPTRTLNEWLQDCSLTTCGWGNVIGDVSLLISGLMSGRGKEALSGALYTVGGGVLARYGNVKSEYHVNRIAEETAQFLKKQAVDLPEDACLTQIAKDHQQGLIPNVEKFLTRYPSQTTVGIYTLGAAAMLQSGIRHKKAWDIAYGVNSTVSGAASIIIPEKKFDAGHPKRDGVMGVWDWIQEKPLRAAGYAYVVSDIALGLSAYKEYKANPKQRSYIFKFISTGSYLVSSLLMAISNKEHTHANGKFDADEQRKLEAMAAEVIASQPKPIQEPLIYQVSGFLATQPEMQGGAHAIANGIREQVQYIAQNPWRKSAGMSWRQQAEVGVGQVGMQF